MQAQGRSAGRGVQGRLAQRPAYGLAVACARHPQGGFAPLEVEGLETACGLPQGFFPPAFEISKPD